MLQCPALDLFNVVARMLLFTTVGVAALPDPVFGQPSK